MIEKSFEEVLNLIQSTRLKVAKTVNHELITLYWEVGKYISNKVESAEWGDGIVENLASFLEEKIPDLKGFNKRGLYRMKQFYETYHNDEIVSPVVSQITWSNHLVILSGAKSQEEKQFYILKSIQEGYSKRELESKLKSGDFERTMLSKEKLSPAVTQNHPNIQNIIKDTYVLDFLGLPKTYKEKDLRASIVTNLKSFLLELGKDFSFIGEEYRLQVGNKDFYVDLLFYHRELQCLVAFELKTEDFQPSHVGQINFYLEALDRDVKKHHENPSVGVILCTGKDDEIVQYALSRNVSPALVAEYQTKLIDKTILEKKLKELRENL
jgi:predicted nuclease of restriction endonuclease-like (RecB) superfamily